VGVIRSHNLLLALLQNRKAKIDGMIQKCLFISPAMSILDLLLQMRKDKIKIALVVDEYGGVDGIISLSDVLENIASEIRGINDSPVNYFLHHHQNGSFTIDSRMPLKDLKKETGILLTKDKDIDTVGGAIFSKIQRIPTRGEIITLDSGEVCEIIEANPRQIKRIKIHPSSY